MSLLQAAVLGLVQGLTEFLPVSSSGHLALLPWMMKWPDQGLTYDVALHWGTLLALAIYFWRDFARLAKGALSPGPERRLVLGIALATLPGVVAGFLLEDRAESLFRQPQRIALCLMAFGILLWLADRLGNKSRGMATLSMGDCLAVGAAQALAIVPGVSRSGITLTAALLLGLKRDDAARFSFLMSAPITLGAALLKLKDLGDAPLGAPFWVGISCSALSGLAAVYFLLRYVRTRGLGIFAFYRVAFGALVLLLVAVQPPVRWAKQLDLAPPPRPPVERLSPAAGALRAHVSALAGSGNRAISDLRRLEQARDYVAGRLRASGYAPRLEPYHSRWMGALRNGTTFHNIVAEAGPSDPRLPALVLGAHYDASYATPGADDNASGVAVLLELARRFKARPPERPVRLVAYSTEEPPAFGTPNMGSWHDAQSLRRSGRKIAGMVSLEMLGYYDARPGSQVPAPFLQWLFPKEGNFVGLVGNFRSRGFLRALGRSWRKDSRFPLVMAALPELELIRLSDHSNYWDAGFPALMLTDTSFLRNPNYHEPTDNPDTLDYESMAAVTNSLEAALRGLEY